MTLIDELRTAIRLDSRSLRRIARDAEIPLPSLSRFAARKRNLSPENINKLAGVLGWQLRPVRSLKVSDK